MDTSQDISAQDASIPTPTIEEKKRKKHPLYIWIVILAMTILFGAVGYILYTNKPVQQPAPVVSSQAKEVPMALTGSVSIESTGFNPETLTVKVGTSVQWTNATSQPTELKSDTLTDFGAGIQLQPSDSYAYTFDEPGTYPYYVSRDAGKPGFIVVKR